MNRRGFLAGVVGILGLGSLFGRNRPRPQTFCRAVTVPVWPDGRWAAKWSVYNGNAVWTVHHPDGRIETTKFFNTQEFYNGQA